MLQERVAADLISAMKAGEKERVGALRMLKSAIKNAEIAKGKPLDETEVTEVLSREAKHRRESIAEFRRANREELALKEETELALILTYLPRQMSREEITEAVKKVIAEAEARGPKDKGKVMGRLMPQLKGKADGQMVNEVVGQLLEKL